MKPSLSDSSLKWLHLIIAMLDMSSNFMATSVFPDLNNIVQQMALTDTYRTLHPTEHTSFLSAHGKFCRIDYMLGHQASLNKFKKTEIISSIFSNHNGMKPVINNRKKTEKFTNT